MQPQGFLWNRDNNNFPPRVGLAWNVLPTTVIRAGFAEMILDWNLGDTTQNEIGGANFYNQTVTQPANSYTPLFNINSGVPTFVSPTPNAAGQIPTSASSPSARPSITVYPANYHNPYTLNWNLSIQHSLRKNYVIELDYVGMHNVGFGGGYNWDSRPYGTGIDANGNVIDLTQAANWTYRNTWIGNSSGVNGTQAYKPYPSLGGVNYECNCVRMIYHSGTIKMEKRYSYGLSFLTFLTYQKGIQNSPGNLYLNQQEQRAVTGQTQKYRFVSSMTYELPLGKGKHWMNHSRVLDYILGGYSFAWNYSIWAPTPMGIGYSNGTYLNPATGTTNGGRQDYPDYEPEPGGGIYLIQDPQLRSNWQDIGRNRFVQAAQNPSSPTAAILRSCIVEWSHLGQQLRSGRSFVHQRQPARQRVDRATDHRGQCVDVQGLHHQGAVQGANPAGLSQPVQVVQLERGGHHHDPNQPRHFHDPRSQ